MRSLAISSRSTLLDPAPTVRRSLMGARIIMVVLAIAVLLGAAPAAGSSFGSGPLLCGGWQWVGLSSTCTGGGGWDATPLFIPPIAGAPPYCVYAWTSATAPDPWDLANLAGLGATDLTEDCPVVYPQGAAYDAASSQFLRAALRAHVGSADLVAGSPNAPMTPNVRVVIVDTAPDALHGGIPVGVDRHGDTLAHLVEDIVCSEGACFAEVATALALPRTSTGTASALGGHSGTLSDLAGAIHRAVVAWQQDPVDHLVLNLSVGWEHFAEKADCTAAPSSMYPPARAVHDVLQFAAQEGALIIAAAGNDTGGTSPPHGLICPAKWQAIAVQPSNSAAPIASLVVAAHGVDYSDIPLANARPGGLAAFAGTAIGGVAWGLTDTLPPALTGSSVAAAVLSAVSAVVWAVRPSWDGSDILEAVHLGGEPLDTADDYNCPLSLSASCYGRRVSLCGALSAAQEPVTCGPSGALTHSQPPLPPGVVGQLVSDFAGLLSPTPVKQVAPDSAARFVKPSRQSTAAIFPQPFYPTCPTCVLTLGGVGAASNPVLYVSSSAPLMAATLVVTTGGAQSAMSLGPMGGSASYALNSLSPGQGVTTAYITGLDNEGFSVTTQVLVQP